MRQYYESERTGRKVYPSECARILSVKQIIFYLKRGIEIMDFYQSIDYKTGDDVLVFLVGKKESAEVYKEWLSFKNGNNEQSD